MLVCGSDDGSARCEPGGPPGSRVVVDDDGYEGRSLYAGSSGTILGAWSLGAGDCPGGAPRDDDGACPWPDAASPLTPSGLAPPSSDCGATTAVPGALHVDSRAPRGGDGSRERPFSSLDEALLRSDDDLTLQVAPGRYALASLRRSGALRLLGTCAANTRLQLAEGASLVIEAQSELQLSGVTVEASGLIAQVDRGGRLLVSDSALASSSGVALRLSGAEVTVTGSEIASADPGEGAALRMQGGRLLLRASTLRARGGYALEASEYARIEADDVRVEAAGAALAPIALDHATIALRRAELRGGVVAGALFSRGAEARLDAVRVSGQQRGSAQRYRAGGVVVQLGARLIARDLVIERSRITGLALRDSQSAASVDGLTVREIEAVDGAGRCVDVNDGATATLRRVSLRGCHDAGLHVAEFSRVDLRDARIRDVAARADGLFGFGVAVVALGHLDARRVLIERCTMGGVGAAGLPESHLQRAGLADPLRRLGALSTTVRLRDVIVRQGRPLEAAASFGVVGAAGVQIDVERLAVSEVPGAAVAITPNGYPTAPFVSALVNSARIPRVLGDALLRVLPSHLDGSSALRGRDLYVRQGAIWRVGYDGGSASQPPLRASIGLYVAPGCTLDGERLSLHAGEQGEYGLVQLGATRVAGIRMTPMRRCSVAAATTAAAADLSADDSPLPPPARCAAAGLEVIRLPLSAD